MAGRFACEPDQNSVTSRRPHLPAVAKAKEAVRSLPAWRCSWLKLHRSEPRSQQGLLSLRVLFVVTGGRCGFF